MAERPIFIPHTTGNNSLVKEIPISFKWSSGYALVQKRKNIDALHASAAQAGYSPILEISTKSDSDVGIQLSAFNLKIHLKMGFETTLESAFQGSKVFEAGGPFTSIYQFNSYEAKKDNRIRNSGKLIGFFFEGINFPLEPKTVFYDWLYIKALSNYVNLSEKLKSYAGFSDIEFNPKKSINCQARACALFVALERKKILQQSLQSVSAFIQAVTPDSFNQPYSDDVHQDQLF